MYGCVRGVGQRRDTDDAARESEVVGGVEAFFLVVWLSRLVTPFPGFISLRGVSPFVHGLLIWFCVGYLRWLLILETRSTWQVLMLRGRHRVATISETELIGESLAGNKFRFYAEQSTRCNDLLSSVLEHQATATAVRTLEPIPRDGALIKIYMRQSAVRAMNLIQYKVCVGQKGSLSDKSVLT